MCELILLSFQVLQYAVCGMHIISIDTETYVNSQWFAC